MKKRTNLSRLAKSAYRAWGIRTVALLLTIVMCAEALLGNGVSVALAQGIEQTQQYLETSRSINDANNGSADSSTTDENGTGGFFPE